MTKARSAPVDVIRRDAASVNTGSKKRAKETHVESAGLASTQSERFIAKARELGLDERDEAFDAALTKVARHKEASKPVKK